jgi:hypothetical protein
MGDVTITILDGKSRIAEEVFGWGRASVSTGKNEFRSGIVCVNDLSARHKPKAEEKHPGLLADIRELLEPSSQTDPRLRATLLYTDMTAQALYDALVANGWSKESLPTLRTISNILNRHEYRLRTVAKTKVQKTAETELIFANVWDINACADADPETLRISVDPETLRISVDTKATVNVGYYSRGGQSRGRTAVAAWDP